MLIDVSYFTSGPRHIQNATAYAMPTHEQMAVNEAIEGYIHAFQGEFLHYAVGPELAGELTAYLKQLEEAEESGGEAAASEEPSAKGLESVCRRLRESFADYVFYHILRNANTQATMTGLVRLKCANEYIAPIRRQVRTWNGMVERNRRFVAWTMTDECPFKVSIDENLLTPINELNL